MSTEIITCNCPNEYQDQKFGKSHRAANKTGGKKISGWRCTSCGHETDRAVKKG